MAREYNFDGIVGTTHSYSGLSPGNLAAVAHAGELGNPRAAALQGLEKMRFVAALGVRQGVLPPQPRPDVDTLRRLGFAGDDAQVLKNALRAAPELLRACSSASAMWTANAATVAPSADAPDRRVHLTPANLSTMFHRSLEAATTTDVLRAIFADARRFIVHDPLPSGPSFADEGAANHTRLSSGGYTVHLCGWGRDDAASAELPRKYPARQTRAASAAVARLHGVEDKSLLWQQAPSGIDAGAFHSDVLSVGNQQLLLFHEHAFVDHRALLSQLGARLGADFAAILATEAELPAAEAVRAYPFNSQLLSLPSGKMAIVAPREAQEAESARAFLERVVAEAAAVENLHYIDVNASMKNGGGPACLRLRVVLEDEERAAIRARVFFDDGLGAELESWVRRHYRDRLTLDDLADPALLDESRRSLDELTTLLRLGSIYGFQR
jgi:succinylarginine dihydrolase